MQTPREKIRGSARQRRDTSALEPTRLEDLRTVRRLAEDLASAGLTEASIRWAIFNADSNGLTASGAIVRPPETRRVLIDRRRFELWLCSR